MTTFKLLASIFILTLSCIKYRNDKTVLGDIIKPIVTKSIVDTNPQPLVDSNYLDIVENIKENPYSDVFDTSIKGGFSISFSYDTANQYLIYKKGEKVIDTISGCSLGLLYKNLGYIGADFDKTFVFVNSYGSGNPHYIRLIDKETAKDLISRGSAWIDVDTIRQVLLYSKADVPFETDSMTLLDTKTMKEKEYAFPEEIFSEPEKLNRITLINITDKTFTIEYEYQDGSITKRKTYSR